MATEKQNELLDKLLNKPVEMVPASVYSPVYTLQLESERELPEGVYTKDKITTNGKEFTRQTHALLFQVVDWLEINSEVRNLSSRKLAAAFETTTGISVSHVWAAIAKNYWIVNGN